MDVKEYLNYPRKLYNEICKDEEKMKEWERLSHSVPSPSFDEPYVDRSRSYKAPFERWILKILDYKPKVEEKYKELFRAKDHLMDTISGLDDPLEQFVLIYRYVNLLPWDEVFDKMNLKKRRVFAIHSNAISKLREGEPYDFGREEK